jgi:uncharacterized protein YndB with AHSA1/START domain
MDMAKQLAPTKEQTVVHNTFVIERSYSKPPQKVFAAFADEAKKRRWYGESDNHTIEEYTSDFRVGGSERFRYRFNERAPFPGVELSSDGSYQDIIQDQRIVTASTMSIGGKRISSTLVTIELLPTDNGTDLICTHQGAFYEGADGPEMREGGWKKLFDRLDQELAR